MSSNLVELARFPSSAEAAMVRSQLDAEGIRAELAGEAAASWLWHFGSAIDGVRLLVNEEDVDRALEILGADNSIDEAEEIDFGDDSEVDDTESEALPDDLLRAWRAALIGYVLFPPILNLYSSWLLIRNRLFIGRCRNWRVFATCAANAILFSLIAVFFMIVTNPSPPPPQYFMPDGTPIDVKYKTETDVIPLIP